MMFQENYKGILENNYQKILLNEPLSPKTSLISLVYLLSLVDWLGPEKESIFKKQYDDLYMHQNWRNQVAESVVYMNTKSRNETA